MTATFSRLEHRSSNWQTLIIGTFAFWLSSCLILDLVIMPSLYLSGMVTDAGFAPAGLMMFGAFNRIELLCAALGLTGLMALRNIQHLEGSKSLIAIILSSILLGVVLVDTYGLVPQMSALGVQLNLFDPATAVPDGMNQMHKGYFVLEMIKIVLCGTLLNWSCRPQE